MTPLFIMTLFTVAIYYTRTTMSARVAAIEKWTAVADICRCLHNFNGVLQICAAFTNAAVYRLKKTWDKVPKNVSICLNGLGLGVSRKIKLQTNEKNMVEVKKKKKLVFLLFVDKDIKQDTDL